MLAISKNNKKVIIEGNFEYFGENVMCFYFEGIDINNRFDINEAKDTINTMFKSNASNEDINNNLIILRTIFRDLKEEKLEMKLIENYKSNFPFVDSHVIYIDGKLDKYRKNIRCDFSDKAKVISLEYYGKNNGKNLDDSELISCGLDSEWKRAKKLDNVKSIQIDESIKKLCETYREFYKKDIDFRSMIVAEEIQVMLKILYSYNIWNDQSVFKMLSQKNLFLYNKPLGKVKRDESYIELDEKYRRLVSNIGEVIRQHLVVCGNCLDDIKVAAFINATGGDYNGNDYSKQKIESGYTLARKINSRINKI